MWVLTIIINEIRVFVSYFCSCCDLGEVMGGGSGGSQFPMFQSIVTWSHLLKQCILVAGMLVRTAYLIVERKQRKKDTEKDWGDIQPYEHTCIDLHLQTQPPPPVHHLPVFPLSYKPLLDNPLV